MRRIAAVSVLVLVASPIQGMQPVSGTPPLVVYADDATPTGSLWRVWTGSEWTAAAAASTTGAGPAFHDLAVCSDWDRMALVRLDTDNDVRLQVWDGGEWGPAATLTADAGTHRTKVAAAAFEHASRELLVVYREGSAAALSFRAYSVEDPAEQTLTMSLAAAPEWVTLSPRPGSDHILLLVSAGGRLHASIWDGAAFGSTVLLESSLQAADRPFDGVFTTNAGQAVVVWSATSGTPRTRTWNGSSWSAVASLPSLGAGAKWVTLAANPGENSDEVLLATVDTARDINLNRWNGSSWGAFTEVETSAAADDERRVDIAYQPDGARAIAAWHRSGETAVRYRAWNGVSWSSTLTGPDVGSEAQRIILGPGREPTQVLMATRRRGTWTLLDYLLYAQTGSVNASSATVNGPTGQGVAGVLLPSPPAGSAGANNLTYGNNATATLAPGTYGELTAGNNFRLTLTAGTYIFKQITIGNSSDVSNEFTLNTASGDITIIVANGNLSVGNNAGFINTGGGRVVFHIKNGNVVANNNNTRAVNADFFVYNGNIDLGNNSDIQGQMYASGNVNVGSGTVSPPAYYVGSPGRVSAAVWTDGVPSAPATLSTSVPGPPWSEAVAIGRRPPFLLPRITSWEEVDPLSVP